MEDPNTESLAADDAGDTSAAEGFLPLVYQDLRRLAAARLSNQPEQRTLQATALVHEAYLRLENQDNTRWKNRAHYFAAVAETMRRVLVDRARAKAAEKRGGAYQRIDLDDIQLAVESKPHELCAVNDAIEELAAFAPEKADIVKLRYFVGMTLAEAGQALGVSEITAKRYWSFARAWLYRRLSEHPSASPSDVPDR